MKLHSISILTALLTALMLTRNTFGIMCYNCNSLKDSLCVDPFGENASLMIVDCDKLLPPENASNQTTFCRKTIQRSKQIYLEQFSSHQVLFLLLVFKETRIIRSCGYIESDNRKDKNHCRRIMFSEPTESVHCECNTDMCNRSINLQLKLAVIVGVVQFFRSALL